MNKPVFGPLEDLLPGSDDKGIPSMEDIIAVYRAGPAGTEGISDNPRMFCWQILCRTDYLMQAGQLFPGHVVVDLGAGAHQDGYLLANIVGARAYIAVEPSNMKYLHKNLTCAEETKTDEDLANRLQQTLDFLPTVRTYDACIVKRLRQGIIDCLNGVQGIPASLVAEDALGALHRLPDDSVAVLACGLDACMIATEKYALAAEEEIARVVRPDSAYLGVCSRLRPARLLKDDSESDRVFEKFVKKKA